MPQQSTTKPPVVKRAYQPRNGKGAAHAILANLITCPMEECDKYHAALLAEVRRLREAAVGR